MSDCEKVIFHIDVNSAFLSWEAVYRLEQGGTVDLREIPCAVGGDKTKRRGIILAKSLSAKACGVKTGEPLTEALKKCPSLIVVPAHHSMYRRYSQKFLNILREYSPSVEQYSIDEAFMDMTGMEKLIGNPVAFAHKLKNRISKELGFTVNIGISGNKYLAKWHQILKSRIRYIPYFKQKSKQKCGRCLYLTCCLWERKQHRC